MYLVDTNVWLERLLDQKRAEEVGQFMSRVASDEMFMTDFCFHSIGIAMQKLDRLDGYVKFVRDVFISGNVAILSLEPGRSEEIVRAIKNFHLDYDDAYQYVAAFAHNLDFVSFDSDFDRTDLKRKTPTEVI